MQRFPGRFLEEIEQVVDWGRLMRVIELERIEAIEAKRDAYYAKKIQATDLTPDDWEAIAEHDQVLERYG